MQQTEHDSESDTLEKNAHSKIETGTHIEINTHKSKQ